MVQTGFYIGDNDWWVMAYLDIRAERELDEVFGALIASGSEIERARRAVGVLSRTNTGYTFTNFRKHVSVMCAAKASCYGEMFSTITHEIKHLTEHLSEYYDVDPKSEESAYLQGEISRQMYDAAAYVICPNCGGKHFNFKDYVGNDTRNIEVNSNFNFHTFDSNHRGIAYQGELLKDTYIVCESRNGRARAYNLARTNRMDVPIRSRLVRCHYGQIPRLRPRKDAVGIGTYIR